MYQPILQDNTSLNEMFPFQTTLNMSISIKSMQFT